jgi:2,4-dienoyl-CoA reductase-like NADH-dependent reductase (Old Yellow Enzyme family)/thioredoxin reductase
MSQLRKLFEPIKIGQMELKNRIVMPAMVLGLGANGMVTDRFKDFYAERARGGVGLIVIGLVPPLYTGPFPPGIVGIYSDEFILGLREFADLMHKCGAKVAMQISALGVLAKGDGSLELVGPSDVTVDRRPDAPKPRPLTVDEIRRIVEAYGDGARRAREAGFDAVELNAIGGTGLISHFLSAHTNKRPDSYGSNLENRARLLLECVESVKQKAGKDYPLLCRVSGADFMEGGNTLEDTKIVAPMMERAGIHAINVSTGWHEAPVPFIQMSVPRANWIYLAEGVKQVVRIPVIGGTRIPDPRLAEQILAEGRVDMVYIARPLIADPEWPNKAREGRFDEIRPCIACSLCFDGLMEARSIRCSVNARAGREAEYSIEPAKQPKRVFVIGGGPAGMEAARVASLRGHEVILADNRNQLGGQLLVAVLPPHKEELGCLTRYLAGQMEKLGVKVRLGREVTVKTVEKLKPDVVIVATGAAPKMPDSPGVGRKKVATAIDVLTGRREVGERVAIVGGGLVGCETAEFLAEKDKKVTILEMLDRIGADIGRTTRWVTMGRLRSLGVRMERNAKVEEITDKGVRATRNGGSEFFEADSVVLAVGMEPNRELARKLEGKVEALYVIGDSAQPGKITEAIESALRVAREV